MIVVKGTERHIEGGAMSYEDVIAMADLRTHRNPSVTWKRRDGSSGTLSKGQYVTPDEGMVLNAAYTGGA